MNSIDWRFAALGSLGYCMYTAPVGAPTLLPVFVFIVLSIFFPKVTK